MFFAWKTLTRASGEYPRHRNLPVLAEAPHPPWAISIQGRVVLTPRGGYKNQTIKNEPSEGGYHGR